MDTTFLVKTAHADTLKAILSRAQPITLSDSETATLRKLLDEIDAGRPVGLKSTDLLRRDAETFGSDETKKAQP